MIRYPIRLSKPQGPSIRIRNPREFTRHYSNFIDDNWKRMALLQKYEDLFVNWQGVMFGRGEIWFSSICQDKSCSRSELKITAINPSSAD
jgi:hypothetical protein